MFFNKDSSTINYMLVAVTTMHEIHELIQCGRCGQALLLARAFNSFSINGNTLAMRQTILALESGRVNLAEKLSLEFIQDNTRNIVNYQPSTEITDKVKQAFIGYFDLYEPLPTYAETWKKFIREIKNE